MIALRWRVVGQGDLDVVGVVVDHVDRDGDVDMIATVVVYVDVAVADKVHDHVSDVHA